MINKKLKILSNNNNNNKKKKYLANIFVIFFLLLINFINFKRKRKQIYFDKYETDIYMKIKELIIKTKCCIMWGNQREFLNGIIRKFKPKKILELGVLLGGSSAIILNAIKDFKNSHLYSIDISKSKHIGICISNHFPYLKNKWTLFKGDIAAKYIEKIGKNIDLVLIDTSHFEPGEILDFLMIFPFLKEEAVIILHDIASQITHSKGKDMRHEWAPYKIFNLIKGDKYLPSGKGILTKNIGAVKLDKNQKENLHDYCRALGGQWEYFPTEEQILTIITFFEKFYDNDCLTILKESIEFNRNFVKDNPRENYYSKLKRKRAEKKNKTSNNKK